MFLRRGSAFCCVAALRVSTSRFYVFLRSDSTFFYVSTSRFHVLRRGSAFFYVAVPGRLTCVAGVGHAQHAFDVRDRAFNMRTGRLRYNFNVDVFDITIDDVNFDFRRRYN